VDAGNFTAELGDFETEEKTAFLWDTMAKMGYDAVTPGDRELLDGIEAARTLYGRNPGVKVVSANVRDKSGSLLFDEYVVVDREGVKVGITGVTSPAYYNYNITQGKQRRDEFTLEDSREALKRVLPRLQKEADVVVVLMHEGSGDARRIVEDVPGIGVVVVGHNPGYLFNPDRVGSTLIVRPGNRGQYLAVLQPGKGSPWETEWPRIRSSRRWSGDGKGSTTGARLRPPGRRRPPIP
jgi:2',3'-cyclic-nucleotide 2'-phosphodiesterase (5'-nucleotidase family)